MKKVNKMVLPMKPEVTQDKVVHIPGHGLLRMGMRAFRGLPQHCGRFPNLNSEKNQKPEEGVLNSPDERKLLRKAGTEVRKEKMTHSLLRFPFHKIQKG